MNQDKNILKLDEINNVYMIGVGGIGMSALARYFHLQGCNVSGYDRTSSTITDELIASGMSIHFEDDPTQIPAQVDLVIYTPAIPTDHKEFNHFTSTEIPVRKRAEVLGMITQDQFMIAVAGAHGKTSISSMITHLLVNSERNVTAFLGGLTIENSSNFIHTQFKSTGSKSTNQVYVVEADEYDRSFLHLHPDIAVITAIEQDHLDVYGSEERLYEAFIQFASQVKNEGHVITLAGKGLFKKSDLAKKLTKERPDIKFYTYSATEQSDIMAENVTMTSSDNIPHYIFDMHTPSSSIRGITSPLPGRHNIENALASGAVAELLKIKPELIHDGLGSFKGMQRRFEIRVLNANSIYIDDYAHHPSEIDVTISTTKELFRGKKLTVIFQPHLFTRTQDLAKDFAASLDLADEVMLMEIYPAREEPIKGVKSDLIASKMKTKTTVYKSHEDVLEAIRKNEPSLLLTLGAGDIDKLVKPITKLLQP